MEFRILGTTEVLAGTQSVALPTGRGRALLILLILHAGEAVDTERLIDELWGEQPPATAATIVQGLVSRLRTALEPARRKGAPARLLQTVGRGYRLAIEPEAVDAGRFKQLLDEARDAEPATRSALLTEALDLWRGPALADLAYEPFAQRAIAALEELRVTAMEDRFEAELECGRGGELVPELEGAIAAHPFRERLRGFLMLALYRAGRQAQALEAYRRTRTLLVEEVGVEPGPALRDLEAAILRQDPALALRSTQPADGGSAAAATGWLPRERRTVTVVVSDLVPPANPAVDAEATGRLGARAANVAAEVLEGHGGRVERSLGDTLTALFGFPVAHEDDVLRAVRAATEVRATVEALNDDPSRPEGVRYRSATGIETGDVVVTGPGGALSDVIAGPLVTAARRLQQAADDGEVIVGPAAKRLLRGAAILKPIEATAAGEGRAVAWRVLELVMRAPAVPRALEAPLVGRQQELTRLRSAFRRAIRSGAPARMTIVGDAGVGKSRLATELVASIGEDAQAITQRCTAHGEGFASFPVREALIEAAGLHGWRALHMLLATGDGRRIAAEIASAIELQAEPENSEALVSALRRLFEALARDRPLIVVLEDLHWAGSVILEVVDRVASAARGPVFLIGLARPDLIEQRPEVAQGDLLWLEPLAAAHIDSLLTDRAGPLEPATLRRIIEVAHGNPLFAEQMLASLFDLTADAVPLSLRGLLTMRLDRLGPGERDLLRGASIIGVDFDRNALSALLPNDAGPFIERHLDTLERKRFIQRTGEDTFRFGHVMIQLAAYQSMTRQDRARLHERFAGWLERESPVTFTGLGAILGDHVARAGEHRRISGLAD